MKKSAKFRSFVSKILNSNIFLIILSLIISVVSWAAVKYNYSETTTKTLSDMKVSVDVQQLEDSDFHAFYDSDTTVEVEVSGKSYEVNSSSFSANDITVSAVAGYVDSVGTKELTITATSNNPDITVNSVTPSKITVYFDRQSTREFNVQPKLNVSKDEISTDEYTVGEYVCSPQTLTITGPETTVNAIKKVRFSADIDEDKFPITETTSFEAKLSYVFEADSGAKRFRDYLTCKEIDEDSVSPTVTVPVTKEVRVPVTVDFINLPEYYNDHDVPVTISPSYVDITQSGEDVPEKISIGSIDFRTLKNVKTVKTIKADSAENLKGYASVSGQTFKVTIDLSSMEKTTITDIPSNIVFTGQQEGKTYTFDSDNSLSLVIYGSEDSISKITADDIQLEIDVSALEDTGSQKVEITNFTLSYDDCWVYGNQYCTVTVE